MIESYHSVLGPSEALLKEKGSKFFAYAFPVKDQSDVKSILERIKKEHHTARHWCFAYRLNIDGSDFRSSDDGEPSHSAGDPILRQITSKDLTYVLVIVVRYFGGVKLGVGGLIQAYGGAAKLALDQADTILIEVQEQIRISFEYAEMNEVMRVLKRYDAEMVSHEFMEKCWIIARTPRSRFKGFVSELEAMHKLALKRL